MRLTSAPSYWTTGEGRAMGSRWRVVLGDAPDGLQRWVADELARLELAWSRFDPASELRRVELSAAGRWVPISTTLATAIGRALRLAEATAGVFDPTVGSCLAAIGYDRTFCAVTVEEPWAVDPVAAAGVDSVELDLDGPALRLRPGTRLDLGGVGKGLAADVIVDGALHRGAASACAGVGGDIRVGGVTPAAGWPVPLADPAGGPLRTVTLDGGALVTSTTTSRRWRRAGRLLHHLVDPATGRPATTGIRAVIASADTAWWAEGIAKAALISGHDHGARLMERTAVSGWIVGDDSLWTTVGSPP